MKHTNALTAARGLFAMGLSTCAVLAVLASCESPSSPQATDCENLAGFTLDHATVTSARAVSGGREIQWKTALIGIPFIDVPDSCRIRVVSTPTSDSQIQMEVWFPLSQWNGKFQGIGNGGFAGSIDTLGLALALQMGYAVASTDTGHEASDKDGSWALGHIEKIRDYGYRAIHETAVVAKALIVAFYGESPAFSYFASGSNGGRQGLMEAQRYPEDYDGIIAGCPALDPSGTLPVWAWLQQSMEEPAGAHITPEKLKTVATAVLRSCDTLDGVEDGVIDNPRVCDFNPQILLCQREDTTQCLTGPEVHSLRNIYSGNPGATDPQRRRGFEPGGELGWGDWITGSGPGQSVQHLYALEFYRHLVYGDARWTLRQFDYERNKGDMRNRIGSIVDATDPDLSAFAARGGKLIMYHGWSDPALPPSTTTDYYASIQDRMGRDATAKFVRLYMAPGVEHCFLGPGPNSFGQLPPGGKADPSSNMSAALERWVEQGVAPARIVATKYEHDLKGLIDPDSTTAVRTRPLCVYPEVAHWNGKGSDTDAKNFSCVPPDY